MAEPLKNSFGPEMVHRAASNISEVFADFDVAAFTSMALDGFDDLELTPRAHQIAAAMATHLPADRARAIEIVIASLGPERENCDPDDEVTTDNNPMSIFYYLPHGYFVAAEGGDHFDAVMRANYEITKRFTSEFSIRTPLRDHPERTLAVLREWATDDNVHVRRLVSEGTRSRLPWSFRLKQFQQDPTPVVELLELLQDDAVEYVRRSVANNLNDIAKDHPQLVVDIAQQWWTDGDNNRRRLVRHALRSLIKAGDPGALAVLGYVPDSPARVGAVTLSADTVTIGDKIKIEVTIENPSATDCGALVDLQVHFVKANGSTSPKVFKGSELELGAGESGTVRKTISVAQHSTRKHYVGEHRVEVLINGTAQPGGAFTIVA